MIYIVGNADSGNPDRVCPHIKILRSILNGGNIMRITKVMRGIYKARTKDGRMFSMIQKKGRKWEYMYMGAWYPINSFSDWKKWVMS